jgi:hypothetical protein
VGGRGPPARPAAPEYVIAREGRARAPSRPPRIATETKAPDPDPTAQRAVYSSSAWYTTDGHFARRSVLFGVSWTIISRDRFSFGSIRYVDPYAPAQP